MRNYYIFSILLLFLYSCGSDYLEDKYYYIEIEEENILCESDTLLFCCDNLIDTFELTGIEQSFEEIIDQGSFSPSTVNYEEITYSFKYINQQTEDCFFRYIYI